MKYVVFNNDWPLVVCNDEVQAVREVAAQMEVERKRVAMSCGRSNFAEIHNHMKCCFFHIHDVPESTL